MQSEIVIALITSTATLLVSTGGWVFAFFMQRRSQNLAKLERRIGRLENEVRARIAMERVACQWISELQKTTFAQAQRQVRSRAFEQTGLRAKMSPSQIEPTDAPRTSNSTDH